MSEKPARTSRKRGRPTEVERAERRDQILDSAVELFTAHGYGRVTIDEIASAARVTKRTIYTYFGDKAEVFTAAIERFRLRALKDLARPARSIEDVSAGIIQVLHADDAVGMHRLMISECQQFPELASNFYDSGPRGYVELLASILTKTSIAEDAAQVAEALFGLLLGEPHRRRLLGLSPAPTKDAARLYALEALSLLGLDGAPGSRSPNGRRHSSGPVDAQEEPRIPSAARTEVD
ncbi:TetR/AcrR family transcriptional regulator [Microbacterium sp.]|uniref:TetR/AcrR family transcriptional regulator n=1 Tax=Microbacterium sp. TaxID=51671 RepID=UPI002811D11A|nr:TetR/AcrR family transcriptional regulator [Microbacterium sp.]